ncbi:MAG TPA: HDIG domain-containing protein [bacterium]|nr:HDIG domain-containing protein [bacterium]HPS29700.1 HDIG domain-containing protein [bacterium]
MERNDAIALLNKHLSNKNLVKHCVAAESAMENFAKILNEDEKRWALAGLLHDLDYDYTKDNFAKHGKMSGEILRKEGFDDTEILDAIVMHSGNIPATSEMGKALYAIDPATGLVTAGVFMSPEKNIHKMGVDFLIKRFKEKRFAAGANRDAIMTATENFGITLEQFLEIVLNGMRERSEEIGLGKKVS